MPVRVEKNGFVTTVILDDPEVKNAVDPQAARDLADAFRAFDRDETSRAAGRRSPPPSPIPIPDC